MADPMQNLNNKTLFISDLHIESANCVILRSLLSLLDNQAQGADALYILGDLFEAWVGDDDINEAGDIVAGALKKLSQQGTRIYLMHGNRDFLLGPDFAARCGGELIEDPLLVDLYGQKALLLHGDSLCTRDTAYMSYRTQVRDPVWQQAFLQRPLLERHMVAQQIRQQSRDANSQKASDIMDVTPQEVVDVLIRHQVNLMIHGHTHRPGIHTIRLPDPINDKHEAVRIVLGSWEQKAWMLEFSAEGYDLKHFSHPA
jgi:UDP-2,3-diacylglucosamine hydrolase